MEPERDRRPPRGLLVALLVLLAAGPVGLALTHRDGPAQAAAGPTLGELARRAGCRLTEFDRVRDSNRRSAAGSTSASSPAAAPYVGRRPPSQLAEIHALMHGRVLVQYRPDLPAFRRHRRSGTPVAMEASTQPGPARKT